MPAPQRPPTIDPPTWQLALHLCTPAELQALELDGRGLPQHQAAHYLGISRRSFRNRLENAAHKLATAKGDHHHPWPPSRSTSDA